MSGYLDNFRVFDALLGRGLTVNLRADEVFGGRQTIYSEIHTRTLIICEADALMGHWAERRLLG